MLGNIVGGFVVILVGVTLAPSVANAVADARGVNNTAGTYSGNVTGASATILQLTVLFYNLAIASSAMGIAVQGLKNGGLM